MILKDKLLDIVTSDVIPEATLLSHQQSTRKFVGFMVVISLILVFSTVYLANIFSEHNPFAVRPTDGALESQEVYSELIQTDATKLDGSGVKVCII